MGRSRVAETRFLLTITRYPVPGTLKLDPVCANSRRRLTLARRRLDRVFVATNDFVASVFFAAKRHFPSFVDRLILLLVALPGGVIRWDGPACMCVAEGRCKKHLAGSRAIWTAEGELTKRLKRHLCHFVFSCVAFCSFSTSTRSV